VFERLRVKRKTSLPTTLIMTDGLPPAMTGYTFVHGQPCVAMGAADDIATDGPWVRLRYRCATVRALLERISVERTIVVDCSLFAQLVVLCVEGEETTSSGCFHLGTGRCAMELLAARSTPVCALALPKALYDEVKHVNSDSAQYLVGPDERGRYLGLAKVPMRATLDEWRAYLRESFLANARQQEDGALKTRQLDERALYWNLVDIMMSSEFG